MRDRIAAIDAALASSTDPAAVEQETFRHVHTMKGAALAVGDVALRGAGAQGIIELPINKIIL